MPPDPRSAEVSDGLWTERMTIRSYEVDLQKRATVENLCRHFQEAAWNHAELLGAGYGQLQQQNRIWVMSRLLLQIHRSPLWGEGITVRTWPRPVKSVFALRDFEMLDTGGARVLAGSSAWLVLDDRTRKPQRLDRLISGVPTIDRRALERDPEKVPAGASGAIPLLVTVRYSDIDVNGHANYSRYIGWLMDSYPLDFHRNWRLHLVEMNFLGETMAGQELALFSHEETPGAYRHSIQNRDNGQEVCRARMIWLETGK